MLNTKIKIIPLLEVDIIIQQTPDTFMGDVTRAIGHKVVVR